MKFTPILAIMLVALSLPACQPTHGKDESHKEQQKIVVTNPLLKDITLTQPYVCQIHARKNTAIKSLVSGYLEPIQIKEGQEVKKDSVLFQIMPVLYKAKRDAEYAEYHLADLEYINTTKLAEEKEFGKRGVVSQMQVQLDKAKRDKAEAKWNQSQAELDFATIKAPFDGIVDRQLEQQGSLIKEGDVLTTLSDTHLMWVYFNVPEARYLEYRAGQTGPKDISRLELVDSDIELVLADGSTFPHSPGNTVTIEGQFNNMTGNIPFRADFPNPDRLLRQGQTGTVLIHRRMKGAIVIPQRATFEVLDKRYVFIVGEDHVVKRRLITVQHELEDTFVIKSGLDVNDKIIFEGVREVNDGVKVEYEFRSPEEILPRQKFAAE